MSKQSSPNIEIERKFLVDTTSWLNSQERKNAVQYDIIQGYICSLPQSTVRLRIKNEAAFLTIKGKATGIIRSEYEYAIPKADAEEMLKEMATTKLSKIRFVFPYQGFIWEVDEFKEEQAPLILAEVELPSENTTPILPSFIRQDVSHDLRYNNSQLAQFPFSSWRET